MSPADRAPRPDAPRHVLDLVERELQRVLLDIHDGAVQYVYAALSQLDLLHRALAADADDPAGRAEALDRADRVRRLLEAALAEIRGFLGAMRPPAFETTGLRELLEGLAVQHETASDVHVAVVAESRAGDPPIAAAPAVRMALYRMAQEALSNATRHGAARAIEVRVATLGSVAAPRLRLTIHDDGRGFDPAAAAADGRLGLAGMRDRATLLGGTLVVASRPGAGTTLTVEVPAG